MSGTYPGQIALQGERVNVDLELSPGTVRLATPTFEIGTWPIEEFKVARRGDGTFELLVEGEQVGFSPVEPEAFAEVVGRVLTEAAETPAGERYLANGNGGTAAPADGAEPDSREPAPEWGEPAALEPASVSEVGTLLRSGRNEQDQRHADVLGGDPDRTGPGDPASPVPDGSPARARLPLSRPVVVGALLVAGALAAIALLWPRVAEIVDSLLSGGDETVATTTTGVTTTATDAPGASTSTTAPATVPDTTVDTVAPGTSEAAGGPVTVFDRPAAEVLGAWNQAAVPVSPALRVPTAALPGPLDLELTSYLSLGGTVAADGTLDRLVVALDPSGPGGSDLLGLQALGVAIAVADPDSTGDDRAALLASLGLDVRSPRLDGIDGSVSREGVAYTLRVDPGSGHLVLTLGPASAG